MDKTKDKSKGKNVVSADFPNLNAVELGAIIGYLVEFNCKVDLVKERFAKVYDKRVSGETIKRILHKHESIIREGVLKLRGDLQECHFYHLPARLREWERVYWEAMKERTINSAKIGEDSYVPIDKPDLNSANSALKGMAGDVHTYEKLQLERQKSGVDEVEDDGDGIDDGEYSAAG